MLQIQRAIGHETTYRETGVYRPDVPTPTVSLRCENDRWIMRIAIDDVDIVTKEVTSIMITMRCNKRGMRWVIGKPAVQTNGETDEEFEGDLKDALKLLWRRPGTRQADLTGELHGGTHGKRDTGVETRKATVIRT
jgi:hypothetical protein